MRDEGPVIPGRRGKLEQRPTYARKTDHLECFRARFLWFNEALSLLDCWPGLWSAGVRNQRRRGGVNATEQRAGSGRSEQDGSGFTRSGDASLNYSRLTKKL